MKDSAIKDTSALTSIRVSVVTRSDLRDIGKKGESYDEVIRRLLDFFNSTGE